MGEDEYRTMMAQGKIAMAIGGPWSIPLIEMANPDIKGKYGFAPHPANKGKKSGTFFGGWYFAMGSKSQNKDLAWEFLKRCQDIAFDQICYITIVTVHFSFFA